MTTQKIVATVMALFAAESGLCADISARELIDVMLTTKSMEIGVKASVRDQCLKAGKPSSTCVAESSIVDQIDLKSILEKVYLYAYTQKQMNDLYAFYSSPVGRKYSQGMLSLLADQMNSPESIPMPNISGLEDQQMRVFQASEVARMELEAKPKLQESISNHLSIAFRNIQNEKARKSN